MLDPALGFVACFASDLRRYWRLGFLDFAIMNDYLIPKNRNESLVSGSGISCILLLAWTEDRGFVRLDSEF